MEFKSWLLVILCFSFSCSKDSISSDAPYPESIPRVQLEALLANELFPMHYLSAFPCPAPSSSNFDCLNRRSTNHDWILVDGYYWPGDSWVLANVVKKEDKWYSTPDTFHIIPLCANSLQIALDTSQQQFSITVPLEIWTEDFWLHLPFSRCPNSNFVDSIQFDCVPNQQSLLTAQLNSNWQDCFNEQDQPLGFRFGFTQPR